MDCAIGARLEARRLSLEFRFGYWMDGFKFGGVDGGHEWRAVGWVKA